SGKLRLPGNDRLRGTTQGEQEHSARECLLYIFIPGQRRGEQRLADARHSLDTEAMVLSSDGDDVRIFVNEPDLESVQLIAGKVLVRQRRSVPRSAAGATGAREGTFGLQGGRWKRSDRRLGSK